MPGLDNLLLDVPALPLYCRHGFPDRPVTVQPRGCPRCADDQRIIDRLPKEVIQVWQEEGNLEPHDFAFAFVHSAAYARGDEQYATWYVATYAVSADDLGDLPDHPTAWLRYLDALAQEDEDDLS